ncbi:MAG: tRNA (adenosine(37)-N6)-threonylcarbamoyltransferase complex transferase subunit TsaD [Kiritimatiellae bacterium]|nr:tRNA (adenosine(37)-N6)-threonylcarbamoyltransferase complex transferase subunit TsaD [Kiritimatiellia bacterium]
MRQTDSGAHMLVLGIETSCDETAVAVARDDGTILSNAIYSQVARHNPFGGIVPEIAARAHVEVLPELLHRAIADAGVSWGQIRAVAATRGPGLATSLTIGLQAAKALSLRLNVPLLGVNHLEAHLYSVLLGQESASIGDHCPVLVLLVSGGHTALARFDGAGQHALWARTVDDAAGEALDKGAKLLGLGYPGGPQLEQAAKRGNPAAIAFPRGDVRNARRDIRAVHPDLCFSFSGLKTALLYHLKAHPVQADTAAFADVAASFQEAVVDTLARQTERALDREDFRALGCAGGVARNARLRERLQNLADARAIPLLAAKPEFCTDNAAMIAALGAALLARGARATPLDADIDPNWSL